MGEAIVARGPRDRGGPRPGGVGARVLPGTEVIPFRLVARPLGEGHGRAGLAGRHRRRARGQHRPDHHARRPVHLPRRRAAGGAERRARRARGGGRPRLGRPPPGRAPAVRRARTCWRRARPPWRCAAPACAPWSPRAACRSAPRWSSPTARARPSATLAGKPALEKLEEVVAGLEPGGAGAGGGGSPGGPRDRREHPGLRPRRLPRALDPRRRPRQRQPDRGRAGARRPDDALPGARRLLGRRGPARGAARRARGAGRREPAGALRVQLQRPRHAHVRGAATTTPRPSREELGDIPAAGLFCNGEIGPVGGRSFLHGFTATMVLFGAGEPERWRNVRFTCGTDASSREIVRMTARRLYDHPPV